MVEISMTLQCLADYALATKKTRRVLLTVPRANNVDQLSKRIIFNNFEKGYLVRSIADDDNKRFQIEYDTTVCLEVEVEIEF